MGDSNFYRSTWSIQERRRHVCGASTYISSPTSSLYSSGLKGQYQIAENRLELMDLYDEMCQTPEINKALMIMAEDIASADVDNETFELVFGEKEPKLSTVKTLKSALQKWQKETLLDINLVDYSYEMLKYGAVFFIRNKNYEKKDLRYWEKLDPRRIRGYKAKEIGRSQEEKITHYLYLKDPYAKKPEYDVIPVEDMIIIKHGMGPYGESVLRGIYKIYRQYELLNNAMIIHRIVRAPQRRVFMIDVGDLSGTRAEEALRKAKANLARRKVRTSDGNVDSVYDVESITEDYFLAINSEQRGSRIETLEGDSSGANIEDVELIFRRLVKALRIPESYLRIGDGQDSQWNDGRVGTMLMDEFRYAARIQLIQKKIISPFENDFKVFLDVLGININEEFSLVLQPPQSLGDYKEMEKAQMQLNVANSAQGMDYLSGRFVAKTFLMLDSEQIKENEDLKLMEYGLDPKKVSERVRMNYVYGDQSVDTEEDTNQG